jgi:TolB-like protein/DNA-binding winged helix-turn-helix (wHTH) protein
MDRPTAVQLRVGSWCVNPATGQISRDTQIVRLEERAMRLLMYLAEHAGEVVSIDELLNHVWSGVIVTPDSVYQAVASLRRLLGDDARQPAYIATVPRLGYRLIATVSNGDAQPTPAPSRKTGVLLTVGAALCLVVALMFSGTVNRHAIVARVTESPRSVAVLPFLDLTTQEMGEEYFADGLTEELIDKLSKAPGLRVPAPTASFYYKGKQVPVAEIARSLGVAYVVDGSVRKSGATLRIAARLVRANDGYVVWSETFDRPADNKLKVQDEVAAEVTQAVLRTRSTAQD